MEILIQIFVEPYHRMFSLDDLSLQFPHAEVERVSPFWLTIYAALAPIVLLILWAIVFRPGAQKTHVTILGLLLSLFLTGLITDIIKNTVGRPRPDLIARCKPKNDLPPHVLITIDACTETDHHLLQDGWRSFPSGHSSFAFAGLGYLALFLAAQLRSLRPSTPLPFTLLPLVPLVGALLIAISRTEDYRHDVYDIMSGSFLGIFIALGAYRHYYPSLWAPRSHMPFPPPGLTDLKNFSKKPKDEEEGLRSVPNSDDVEDVWDEDADAELRGPSILGRERLPRDVR